MFRRQRPPMVPVPPEPTPPPAPTATVEPATAPEMKAAPEPPAAPLPPNDIVTDTSPRMPMNTPFSTNTASGPLGASALKTEIPRRTIDIPSSPPKRVAPTGVEGTSPALSAGNTEMRKLIVGRDISLSGEIAACDVLVVEGTVEAKLRDGHVVEIADTGLFKGSVEIDDADIGGRFEGDITVRGTLKVRSTGRILGNIRYGTLEVENGGQLSGTIQVLGQEPVVTAAPAPVAAPTVEAALAEAEAPATQDEPATEGDTVG